MEKNCKKCGKTKEYPQYELCKACAYARTPYTKKNIGKKPQKEEEGEIPFYILAAIGSAFGISFLTPLSIMQGLGIGIFIGMGIYYFEKRKKNEQKNN
jgi:ribosomal protein L37E